jgi:transcriptional regulator with XRE-family HTH domain
MRGDRLKLLRTQKNMSQNELAHVLEINRTTIGKYELKNVNPSNEILLKMSKIFNVTPAYLLGFDEKEEQNTIQIEKKRPKDLQKILEQEEFTLNGQMATQEDRERLLKMVEAMYWDAKEKNKRK